MILVSTREIWTKHTTFFIIRRNIYQDKLDKLYRKYQVSSAEDIKEKIQDEKLKFYEALQDYYDARMYEALIKSYKRQFFELLTHISPIF